MKEIKENFSLLLLFPYVFGFAYLFFYYRNFNIPIEHYLEISDIIFIVGAICIKLLIFFIVIEFILHIANFLIKKLIFKRFFKPYKYESLETANKEANHWCNEIEASTAGFLFLFSIAYSVIGNPQYYIILLTLAYTIYKVIIIDGRYTKMKPNKFFLILLICIIITSGGLIYGNHKAEEIMNENKFSTEILKFTLNEKEISTEDTCLKLIGETSNYYFIYNLHIKSSEIYFKKDLNLIVIKNQ